MYGASLALVTSRPLTSPQAPPTPRPTSTPTTMPWSCITAAAEMPASEKTEPTERSMPAVAITSSCPSEISTSGAAACRMLATLPSVSATPVAAWRAIRSANSTTTIASSMR